jgi:hypothetical protein
MFIMSAGYDEQGRFASAQFGEVPRQCICLSYTMYMFSIYTVYHMYMSMTGQAYSEYILHTVYPA